MPSWPVSVATGAGPGDVPTVGVVGTSPGPAPVATLTGQDGIDALRRAYRRRVRMIAAADLTAPEATAVLPVVAAALAHLAGAALETALALARAEHADHATARLAVIGMGKCGGTELNYVSDGDVIFVAEPADGASETEALAVATRLASALSRACSTASGEPALWPVDAALRPEGKNGPLVRTVASHRAYYERWAKTWEFQALLKARVVAGDAAVGEAYRRPTRPGGRGPAGGGGTPDQARSRRASGRGVHGPAAPAGARPDRRRTAQPHHP